MATTPSFAATPRVDAIAIATANTARDGTGTIGTAFTAGASGSRIERIRIQATVTTTAGVVRLFLHDGSTYFLLKEILVTAITPSTTVAAFSAEVDSSVLSQLTLLESGWSLRASTHNAENFNVFTFGGDF